MGRGYTFPYKRLDGRFRPIIPVELAHTRAVNYEVLVDSGADMCILHGDIGRAIGLDIEKGESFEFGGVSGRMDTGYLHTVTITVKHACFQTKVGFSDHINNSGFGMVGQKGFFDRFAVTFDYAEHKLVLHKKKWA
ncbi:MAG TPA: hypothetical protein VMY99_03175 [Nevskiaceae bacterium]|nr:hypothetical protein [Nevskiaceae bacterium]